MGSKNHEIVPTPLISQIAGLRGGSGVHKCISTLAKPGLIARVKNARYDGYRLTYGGLDYLALHALTASSTVYSLGTRIGVGKESDIYVCASDTGESLVLKIHRLGRISFRTVKSNRDYLRHRSGGSWLYMSRLAALKEWAFLKALYENGFPVPRPRGNNRHCVVMDLVDGYPLRQISSVPDPENLFAELIALILRLASVGLIHGDFNEFNIMIKEIPGKEEGSINLVPIVIDFPQCVSIDHANAEYYFDRDVECIKTFFRRRFHFTPDESGPTFAEALKGISKTRLDVEVEASGFSKKMAKELEKYMEDVGANKGEMEDGDEDEDNEGDEGEGGEQEKEEVTPVDGPTEEVDGGTGEEQEPRQLSKEEFQSSLVVLASESVFESADLPLRTEHSHPQPPPSVAGTVAERRTAAKAAKGWAI